jgi:hypothetical protein
MSFFIEDSQINEEHDDNYDTESRNYPPMMMRSNRGNIYYRRNLHGRMKKGKKLVAKVKKCRQNTNSLFSHIYFRKKWN